MSEGKEATAPQAARTVPTLSAEDFHKLAEGELSLAHAMGISKKEVAQMATVGYFLFQNGKYDQSQTVFEALIMLEPKESYFHTALGAVHMAKENLDEARSEFDKALVINPKDIAALTNRGEVHVRKGDVFAAAEDFQLAVELDPDHKDPFAFRAAVLAIATIEKLQEKGYLKNINLAEMKAGLDELRKPEPEAKAKPPHKSGSKKARGKPNR